MTAPASFPSQSYINRKSPLNHNHSIITVNFSLSNYVSVLRNRIYYKLEGFDKDWMSAGYRKGITYTNLNPGKYKLIIKSSEEYSGRESICKEIDIVIKPPFYKSTWAYCLLWHYNNYFYIHNSKFLFFQIKN